MHCYIYLCNGPKDKLRCQYCRAGLRVRMSTTTMMDLPEELLEKIILLLDPVSAIDFSLCDIRLHDLLSNHLPFLSILDKVEFRWGWDEDKEEEEWRMEDNQELVDKIASFIYTTASPAPLLASLQDTILLQFPAKTGTRLGGGETILMERPFHHHPIRVDVEGALLLLHAREGLLLRSVKLGMGSGKVVGGAVLEALSCLAAQTPGRRLELEVFSLELEQEEDGLALDQLLASCGAWSVENLSLAGEVGEEAWQGLARAAARGKVFVVNVWKEIIERGASEDLRKVWDCTKVGWGVGREHVWRTGGEESWGRIEMWSRGQGEKSEESAAIKREHPKYFECALPLNEDDHRKREDDSVQDTLRLAIYSGLILLAYLCT